MLEKDFKYEHKAMDKNDTYDLIIFRYNMIIECPILIGFYLPSKVSLKASASGKCGPPIEEDVLTMRLLRTVHHNTEIKNSIKVRELQFISILADHSKQIFSY